MIHGNPLKQDESVVATEALHCRHAAFAAMVTSADDSQYDEIAVAKLATGRNAVFHTSSP